MPEKHDLLAAILAAKEQGIGAILAFAMAYLRGRYNGGAFTKTVISTLAIAAPLSPFIRDLLDFAGLNGNLNANERVYRLHRFLARLVRLSNASLLKKPE